MSEEAVESVPAGSAVRLLAIGVIAVAASLLGLILGGAGAPRAEIPDAPEATIALVTAPDRVANMEQAHVTWRPPWMERADERPPFRVVAAPAVQLDHFRGVDEIARSGPWRVATILPEAEDGDEAPSIGPTQWSFARGLRSARVSVVAVDGSERVCDRWVFGRWECGPDPWNYVGDTDVEVRGRSESCIWAHPTAEGEIRVRFDDVPRGSRITGRHALADSGATSARREPIELSVWQDGEMLVERQQRVRRGFTNFTAPVRTGDGPTSIEVRIGAEFVGQRHFCFDLNMELDAPAESDGDAVDDLDEGSGEGSDLGEDEALDGSGAPTHIDFAEGSGEGAVGEEPADEGSGATALRPDSRRFRTTERVIPRLDDAPVMRMNPFEAEERQEIVVPEPLRDRDDGDGSGHGEAQ